MDFDQQVLKRLFINTNGTTFSKSMAMHICKLTGMTDNAEYVSRTLNDNVGQPLLYIFNDPRGYFVLNWNAAAELYKFDLVIPDERAI